MSKVWIALLSLVAAGAGYGAVQLALGDSTTAVPKRPVVRTTQSDPTTPVRLLFAPRRPSTLDAVGAAADYLHLLANPSPSASMTLRRLTLPPLTRQALRAERAAADAKRRLPPGAFARGWDLGWRVDVASHRTTTVAIWTVGMVAGSTGAVPPDWSTTVCELRLAGGRWRISSAHTTSGPTPPNAGASSSVAGQFARGASSFHPFTDAP
jgi:hypothetical protein